MIKIKLILLFSFLLSFITEANESLDLLKLYKELHQNPELSFQEKETSERLSSILKNLGYSMTKS